MSEREVHFIELVNYIQKSSNLLQVILDWYNTIYNVRT
jgi:hypothetical protein